MPLILKRSALIALLCVAGLGAAGMALRAIDLVIRMFARSTSPLMTAMKPKAPNQTRQPSLLLRTVHPRSTFTS